MNANQRLVWINRAGTKIPIKDMDLRYLRNVVAFLERRATLIELEYTSREILALCQRVRTVIGELDGKPIYGGQVTTMLPLGEAAQDAYEAELNWRAEHAAEWLHTLPLVQAMDERIAELEALSL